MRNAGASNAGLSICVQISRERKPHANILIPLARQLIALQFAAESFYILKPCSRLFVLCRNRPKDKFRYYPHFEEVRGGVESWLMARWKARVEFLLSVI